ncbi:MAG: tyrosine--tRNA ligase [Clostridiales bacterium]|nr:tyrosine--tRNA ligase [Clostridiales bacterium]
MGKNVFDVLKERGFIKQTVYEEDLYKLLANESVPFYIGFDPTADSLHIGHYIPIMAMAWMQRYGHKPIALIGGGTAMIGDPSGRSDMRSMMTRETIEHNCACFRKQMARFIRFEGENAAIMANNADWLLNLNYVEFLRDIGVHFSVNRMLSAECFKTRMEKGLSFLEFNYMLMQGYDFLKLYQDYGVVLELGGDDQWSNMLAGADLIRKKEKKDAYAMTFTLLLTSEGKKMGKTAKGALWLDENKTTPYEFYQYFRNVEDVKVEECMRLLTFMEMDEIKELTMYNDERMNKAKERLAFEVTKLVHGEEKALDAQRQARAAFGGGNSEDMPSAEITSDIVTVADLLVSVGQAKSKGEAKRLIEGGGVSIDEQKITDPFGKIPEKSLENKEFILHKGKKVHIKVIVK